MSAHKPDKRRGLHRDGEFFAQARQSEPDPALSSSERNVRAASDLVGRQAAPVGEDDRLALSLRELAERLADLGALVVALGQYRRVVVHWRLLGRDELETVGRAAAHLTLAPQVERARAAHQAEVGAEIAARRVERARPAPQSQED